jgi:hypothetical protein
MFPVRFFADDYFAPRYFPKVGATPAPQVSIARPTLSFEHLTKLSLEDELLATYTLWWEPPT